MIRESRLRFPNLGMFMGHMVINDGMPKFAGGDSRVDGRHNRRQAGAILAADCDCDTIEHTAESHFGASWEA
jgi:hypothetical protein